MKKKQPSQRSTSSKNRRETDARGRGNKNVKYIPAIPIAVEKPAIPPPPPLRLNAGQLEVARLFHEKDIIFCEGPAGTGKTQIAILLACQALESGFVDRIVVSRPAKEVEGEELGFLKGTLAEKLHPYLLPFMDVLRTQFGSATALKLFAKLEAMPLAHARGRTLDRCVGILDEAQNARWKTRKTYLTRLGLGGKLIITGDHTQSDFRMGGVRLLEDAQKLYDMGVAGYVTFDQSMQQRNPLLKKIEQAYKELAAADLRRNDE